MTCSKCGSELPSNAKYCPECGMIVEVVPKCTNGHKMQPGQKFCCECVAPLAKHEEDEVSPPNDKFESYKSETTKPASPSKQNKGVKVIVKVIATLIIMVIIATVVNTIGRVP